MAEPGFASIIPCPIGEVYLDMICFCHPQDFRHFGEILQTDWNVSDMDLWHAFPDTESLDITIDWVVLISDNRSLVRERSFEESLCPSQVVVVQLLELRQADFSALDS